MKVGVTLITTIQILQNTTLLFLNKTIFTFSLFEEIDFFLLYCNTFFWKTLFSINEVLMIMLKLFFVYYV